MLCVMRLVLAMLAGDGYVCTIIPADRQAERQARLYACTRPDCNRCCANTCVFVFAFALRWTVSVRSNKAGVSPPTLCT